MRNSQLPSYPAPIYDRLRQAVLKLDPHKAGLVSAAESSRLYGILVETGYPGATVTLVVLNDGTTSLYFSNGGGFIGCGRSPAVQRASQALMHCAGNHLDQMRQIQTCELPETGRVSFHLLAYNGVYAADCDLDALTSGRHPLSELYQAAQAVITQVRLLDEARRKAGIDV